jgi:hypothetical protein
MARMMATERIEQIVCEYRTMFEDVAKTHLNNLPGDDVLYSVMDYGKILQEMCTFLEGYASYREKSDDQYDDKLIPTTKKYYDNMFSTQNSAESPYRKQMTLVDMQTINESYVEGTLNLKTVMESLLEKYPDSEAEQIVGMTQNQYGKLAKVYRDDMELYLWLATKQSRVNPKCAQVKNRVNFWDTNTPVMHRLDRYSK